MESNKATLKEFMDMMFAALMYFQDDEHIEVYFVCDTERDDFGLIKAINFSSILRREGE